MSPAPGDIRWRRVAALALASGAVLALTLAAAVKYEPTLPAPATPPEAERAAARLVTTAAAVHSAVGRGGAWDAAFADAEVNAFLATDLPRNHPGLLPRSIAEPRVRFRPDGLEVAFRIGTGLASTVVRCDLDVRLRGVNQLALAAVSATVGAVPVPVAPVLASLARRLSAAGAVTELRPLDGRMVLVVYIPRFGGRDGPDWRLESLRLDDGLLAVAGTAPGPADEQAHAAEP